MRPYAIVLTGVGLLAGCSFGAPSAPVGGDVSDDVSDGMMPIDADETDGVGIDSPPGIDAEIVSDAQAIDAMPDAPDDDDDDDDGIPDTQDLCPLTPNANNHDHDGDNVGDICDPCPHLAASGGGPDTDVDGVGDACDPDPSTPDRIALFEGFYEAGSISGLAHDAWTAGGGVATIDVRNTSGFHFISWPTVVNRAAVTVAMKPRGASSQEVPGFGVYSGSQGTDAMVSAGACGLGINGATSVMYTARFENGAQLDQLLTPLGGAIADNTTYTIHQRFDRAAGSGNVNHCDTPSPAKSVEGNGRADISGGVRVFAYRYRVDIDYLFVVERSP